MVQSVLAVARTVRAGWLGVERFQVIALAVAIVTIAAAAVTSVKLVERQHRTTLENSLVTVLEGEQAAIRLWARDHVRTLENLAQEKELEPLIQALLDTSHRKEALAASPELALLREKFRFSLDLGLYNGFFVIGPDNINLASSRDSNLGIVNLLTEQPDVLARLWRGESALSRVQTSDVPLKSEQGGEETMFAGAPIRDSDGEVIALLALRFNPYDSLFPLLQRGRIGLTGETYAFDRQGTLLSQSRFPEQLVAMGLLAPQQHSALNIQVRDPGFDFAAEGDAGVVRHPRPLTLMAASATRGNSGHNLDGYRDYRGVQVVGAWLWDDLLDIGLATEQDVSEAYAAYRFIRTLILGGGAFAILILLLLAFIAGLGRRRLREARNWLKAVVETAADGIVVIDDNGRIKSVNPAFGRMFGYSSADVLNNNVSMLMPEPYRTEHDGYLERYKRTQAARIIGAGREVEAQRADGSLFAVELSIARLELDSGLHFAGTVRDISQRKRAESALREERQFSRSVLDSLPALIAVVDETGTIVFVNEAWKRLACGAALPIGGSSVGSNFLEEVPGGHGSQPGGREELVAKLKAVLARELKQFELQIPCRSPDGQRWYQFRATHFEDKERPAAIVSGTDITQRVLAEQKIDRERRAALEANTALSLTQLALERTGIGELWLDAGDGRVLKATDRASAHLGYRTEDLLRLRLEDIAADYSVATLEKSTSAHPRGWGRFEATHLTSDGKRVPVEVTAMHRPGDGDSKGIFVAFVTDITERKHAEAATVQARKDAEAANRAKSTFLATMSHEIRTPLNGIVGAIDLLGHTRVDANQHDLIRIAQESSLALMDIIDDILDFSKIEAGRLELMAEPFNLQDLVETVGQTCNATATTKGVELLIECDWTLPKIVGDPVRLRQIVYNIVGNAIKFSSNLEGRDGRVLVSLRQTQRLDRRVYVVLEVRDNGIGMNMDVQRRLFRPFIQGEETTTRRFGGTGLGLVIS